MKKYKIAVYILYIFFAISLTVFLFSIVYTPLKRNSLENIDLKFKDYTFLKMSLQKKEEQFKDWKSVKSEYLNGKDKFFMRFEDFSKFRNNMKSLFQKEGLSESGFRVDYGRIFKGEYIRASIKFQISGLYKNIKKIIYDLQRIDKFVIIKNLKIYKKNSSMILGNFQLEVLLVP